MPPDMPDGGRSAAGGQNIGANFKVDLPGIEHAAQQVGALTGALDALKKALRDLGSGTVGTSINTMLTSISDKAAKTTQSLTSLTSAVGGVGGGGGVASGPSAPTGSTGSGNWSSGATASAGAAQAAAAPGGGSGGAPPSGMDLTGLMGSGSGDDFMKSMALFPLRFMRDTISTNRQTALNTSSAMSMQSQASGVSTKDMMTQMARFPGSILGTPADQIGLFSGAAAMGATYDFTGAGGERQGKRARGYFEGIRQAQMLNPGAPVAEIAGTIGGFSSNTRQQQQTQMMTGGAFGMIKPAGGGQKSLSEWAESILRWLEGLRGGADRGKPFNYGQLMAQYFPGSNIDAWFDANSVPPGMRDYWWTYALAKTKSGGTTQGEFKITADKQNLAQGRLEATSSLTQTQFGLAGTMSGAYSNKEQANKWLNDMMGKFQQDAVPSALASGPLNFMQFMPDTMEQLLMTLLERSGAAGGIAAGLVGYGGGSLFGDVGDIGDQYTTTGGTGTAGLHPDMRRKVAAMQRANPAISVTSGLRDHAMQQRLKKRGVGRVSGKPSAHTRGMAADLGPASQYGWISQNAGKFGLSSGISQGEPWHVGMGDITDAVNTLGPVAGLGGMLSGLVDLITGRDNDTSIKGLGKMTGSFLSMLSGLIGGGKAYDTNALAFKPDVYKLLHEGSQNAVVNGIGSFGLLGNKVPGTEDGSLVDVTVGLAKKINSVLPWSKDGKQPTLGGDGGRAFAGGRTERYGSVVTPVSEMVAFQSQNEMTRGAAAVRAFKAAGFSGDDLRNFVGIAQRESHWTPTAWADDSDDVSGGLLQINQLDWIRQKINPPFSKEDAMDPYANAVIAHDLFTGKLPGGGTKGGMSPWNINGNWKTRVDFGKADQAIAAAAVQGVVGDVDYGNYSEMPVSAPTINSVQFHNTFHVGAGVGSGGGIDLRRTVTTIADHLESEMNTRLARRN